MLAVFHFYPFPSESWVVFYLFCCAVAMLLLCFFEQGKGPTAENVMWHRAKWVAVAARMIVDRESQPSKQHSW